MTFLPLNKQNQNRQVLHKGVHYPSHLHNTNDMRFMHVKTMILYFYAQLTKEKSEIKASICG